MLTGSHRLPIWAFEPVEPSRVCMGEEPIPSEGTPEAGIESTSDTGMRMSELATIAGGSAMISMELDNYVSSTVVWSRLDEAAALDDPDTYLIATRPTLDDLSQVQDILLKDPMDTL
jgi:hypothetical protein